MKKNNRFASLKNDNVNPFKRQDSSNSKRHSRFRNTDSRIKNNETTTRSSRFNSLNNESEKNTFRKRNYSQNNQRRGYRKYNNKTYYKTTKKLEDSVFQPSCLKNAGIYSLLISKT